MSDTAAAVDAASGKSSEELNYEVFDDGEFYHQQLKDFLESNGDGGDRAMSALEGARRRRSKRAGVDRRATKGRKLRYDVHSKLENFMFPQRLPQPPMNVDQLFASLLGAAS